MLLTELPALGVSADVVTEAAVRAVPQLGAAVTTLTKAKQSEAIIRGDAKRVRDGIAGGHRPYAALVNPARYDPDR